MLERFGYRSALCLSALIAIVHGSFFMYLLTHPSRYVHGIATYVVAAVTIFVGLWLLSKVARYAGVAFYLLSAGAATIPFLNPFKTFVMSVAVLWVITMGTLSLGSALILVFSKSFAKEFEIKRETRPAYKKHLLKALVVLLVVWAGIATLIDIVDLANLASNR